MHKLLDLLLYLYIFLLLFCPTNLMHWKLILLICIIILGYLICCRQNIKVSKRMFSWIMIYIIIGLCSLSNAILSGNISSFSRITIILINPLIYFIFIIIISNLNKQEVMKKMIKVSIYAVVTYNFLYFLSINNIVPIPTNLFIYIKENYGGLNLGFIKIATQNLVFLIYFIPYFLSDFFINRKISDFILVILGVMSAIFSARSAFVIILIIAMFLIIILGKKINMLNFLRIDKKFIIISFFGIIIFINFIRILDINLYLIFEKVKASFDFSNTSYGDLVKDAGGYIRNNQFKDLIQTWCYKPFFGWGDGVNSLNIIRSSKSGAYELTYIALLMQRGIIGFILYWMQMFWIFITAIKIIKKNKKYKVELFNCIIGLTCILIANATNPYLDSFDFQFMIFYPLLWIQCNDILDVTIQSGTAR